MKTKPVGKCLFPHCDRKSFGRGLCSLHYVVAKNLVKSEETSWEALIKAGKIKPKKSKHEDFKRWLFNKPV